MPVKNDNTSGPDPLEVGARIRALRHEAGISQSGLAKILGVTPGAVGNWEQGSSCPTARQGVNICDKFNVSLDYIFRGKIHELAPGRTSHLKEWGELKHDPTGPNLRPRRQTRDWRG